MRTPFNCNIAGLYYHAQDMVSGRYSGYVKLEQNPHDPNAIAIYESYDNSLVGYIPRELTYLVRLWAPTFDRLDCEMLLEIIPEYKVFRGTVTIFDKPRENPNSKYYKKKIYICRENIPTPNIDLSCFATSYGCIVNSSLKKDTDFVIYYNELTDIVKRRMGTDSFHFETIKRQEFISEIILPEERDERFYGKSVSFASTRSSTYADLVAQYLIEHGATLSLTKNASAEVLIKWNKWTNKSAVSKAEDRGQVVLAASDVLGAEERMINTSEKKGQTSLENKKLPSFSSNHSINNDRNSLKRDYSSNVNTNNNSAGCIGVIVLAILLSIIFL